MARTSATLPDASVQEIQLELIRRVIFDVPDNGKRVADSLARHTDLWMAVYMDRLCVSRPGHLPYASLIKLGDLEHGFWNVDTLYALTPNLDAAKKLAEVAKQESWGGEVYVFEADDELDGALGGPPEGRVVVRVWWD